MLHPSVVIEAVYVLTSFYGFPDGEVAQTVDDLLAMPGVEPVDAVMWHHVLEVWPQPVRDLTDAILVTSARTLRCDRLATFERRLARAAGKLGIETVIDTS